MKYKYFGRTGLRVSTLCLGTGPFGVAPLEDDAIELVHSAIDHGINFIDTANSYGNFLRIDRPGAPPAAERNSSEVIVGKALRGKRDKVILATKVREVVGEDVNDVGLSRRHIMQQIDRSLAALQTDYIDVYHCHGPDQFTPIEETISTMDDLVHAGKIRYWAMSNNSAWRFTYAVCTAKQMGAQLPVVHQVSYNLVQRQVENDLIPATMHLGIPLSTYGSLNGGLLAGTSILERPIVGIGRFQEDKSKPFTFPADQIDAARSLEVLAKQWGHAPAHVALAWLMSKPYHASAIIGPETVEELEASLPARDITLEPAQLEALDALLPPPPSGEQMYDAALAAQVERLAE
jgi:aryl-alcohol dehydrogenase-like predicted oxidoreductase